MHDILDEALHLLRPVRLLKLSIIRLLLKLKKEGEFLTIELPGLLVEDEVEILAARH